MTRHPLIENYLAELATRLPTRRCGEIVDELRDGLYEALTHHPAGRADPVTAAHEILHELGAPEVVAAAYAPELATEQGGRAGRATLAALPALAGIWTAALVQGSPPRWQHALWLPAVEHLLASSVLLTLTCGLTAMLTAGRGRRLIPHPQAAPLAAAAAAISITIATAVVLSLTILRAVTAPATLAWPAVLPAAAITAAILIGLHRTAHRRFIT
jgi:hypothetical protein